MSSIKIGDLGMERRATGVSVVFCLTSFGRVTVAATAIVLATMSGVLRAAESEADRRANKHSSRQTDTGNENTHS